MRPRALCDRLNQFLVTGLTNEVFLAVQHHILDGPPRRQTLSPVSAPGMISPAGISANEFLGILDENRYSAVFADGALVIIECAFADDHLESHRYSYIPCPVDSALLLLRPEEITIADWLRDVVLAEGIGVFRSVGTYRFDCTRIVPLTRTNPHPLSHLTFASADCRVPVKGPLSIADFMNFIFDNFYRHHRRLWLDYSSHLTCIGTEPTITWEEQQLHHLHWEDAL